MNGGEEENYQEKTCKEEEVLSELAWLKDA